MLLLVAGCWHLSREATGSLDAVPQASPVSFSAKSAGHFNRSPHGSGPRVTRENARRATRGREDSGPAELSDMSASQLAAAPAATSTKRLPELAGIRYDPDDPRRRDIGSSAPAPGTRRHTGRNWARHQQPRPDDRQRDLPGHRPPWPPWLRRLQLDRNGTVLATASTARRRHHVLSPWLQSSVPPRGRRKCSKAMPRLAWSRPDRELVQAA